MRCILNFHSITVKCVPVQGRNLTVTLIRKPQPLTVFSIPVQCYTCVTSSGDSQQSSMNVNQGTVGSDPVILATAGYDHTVRFWQAHSGICTRTVQHQDSVSLHWKQTVCPDIWNWNISYTVIFGNILVSDPTNRKREVWAPLACTCSSTLWVILQRVWS